MGIISLWCRIATSSGQCQLLSAIKHRMRIWGLEPSVFYALAMAICEWALGGPCLVGGMGGVSLHGVVRTVHMKLDLARV